MRHAIYFEGYTWVKRLRNPRTSAGELRIMGCVADPWIHAYWVRMVKDNFMALPARVCHETSSTIFKVMCTYVSINLANLTQPSHTYM